MRLFSLFGAWASNPTPAHQVNSQITDKKRMKCVILLFLFTSSFALAQGGDRGLFCNQLMNDILDNDKNENLKRLLRLAQLKFSLTQLNALKSSLGPLKYDSAQEIYRLQSQRPKTFASMRRKDLLDEWDLKAALMLERITNSKNDNLLKNYEELIHATKQFSQQDLQDSQALIQSYQSEIDQLSDQINYPMIEIHRLNLDQYQNICSLELIRLNEQACYVPISSSDPALAISAQIRDIARTLEESAASSEPGSYIEIEKVDYKNRNFEANFCLRPRELVDTAVIHHSAGRADRHPTQLNDLQVARHEGSSDPLYMIAYNYIVSSSNHKAFEGRGAEIQGGHAGGELNLEQIDENIQEMLESNSLQCGRSSSKLQFNEISVPDQQLNREHQNNLERGIVNANVTTTGILVTGNFAPDIMEGRINPGGYPANGKMLYPDSKTLDAIARLICRLRSKDHPNLRKITDHNYIRIKKSLADGTRARGTCCPGTIYHRMNAVLEGTKKYCPQFTFELDISPKDYVCNFLK